MAIFIIQRLSFHFFGFSGVAVKKGLHQGVFQLVVDTKICVFLLLALGLVMGVMWFSKRKTGVRPHVATVPAIDELTETSEAPAKNLVAGQTCHTYSHPIPARSNTNKPKRDTATVIGSFSYAVKMSSSESIIRGARVTDKPKKKNVQGIQSPKSASDDLLEKRELFKRRISYGPLKPTAGNKSLMKSSAQRKSHKSKKVDIIEGVGNPKSIAELPKKRFTNHA